MGSDFITVKEYGQMLFNSPRSLSCVACHGKEARGKSIGKYINKHGKKIEVLAPNIRNKSHVDLSRGISNHKGFVPKYFLTNDELIAIAQFLKDKK